MNSSQSTTDRQKNLEILFNPQSIAIVGASRKQGSIGRAILKNIIEYDFQGTVYPVNPKAKSIATIRAYPNLGEIPDPVDLVIVVVPSKYVLSVIEEAVSLNIPTAIVISAGFREIGTKGEELENKLIDMASSIDMRIVGPNCMGIVSSVPRLNATFAPEPPLHGQIGFISQSGALGVVVINYARSLGLGFSKFVSLGNKADINATDMLKNLGDDDNTNVILAYLESFSNPWEFSEIAMATSRKKPIIVVKSGRTLEGARSALSHTGGLSSSENVLSAILSRSGIIRVDSVEQLFACANAFSKLKLPRGNRVAVVSNAGGPGTLAVDSLISRGLVLAEFSEETEATLAYNLIEEASWQNPVDLLASGGPREFKLTLEAIEQDDGVDSILVIFVPPLMISAEEITSVIENIVAESHKPFLAVIMENEESKKVYHKLSFPIYKFPERAVLSLVALTEYAQWRREPIDQEEKIVEIGDDILEIVPNALAEGRNILNTEEIHQLFGAYGFEFPVTHIIDPSANDQMDIYFDVLSFSGFPVVMKLASSMISHKTDVGGVILNIQTKLEFMEAYEKLMHIYEIHKVPSHERTVIIQKYYQGGVELALGVNVDKQFGPILMLGSGGVLLEIWQDLVFEKVPVARRNARSMIKSLKGYPLLLGYRGTNPIDIKAIEDSILRLSQLVSENRGIVELDINPLLALEFGYDPIVLDARVFLSQ